MLRLDKDVAELASQATDERVQALKRSIPCSTIKAILKRAGQDGYCARLPKWCMVWLVIGCRRCIRRPTIGGRIATASGCASSNTPSDFHTRSRGYRSQEVRWTVILRRLCRVPDRGRH